MPTPSRGHGTHVHLHLAAALAAMLLSAGCMGPLRGLGNLHDRAPECSCGDVCEGHCTHCEGGLPHCTCGHLKALGHVTCEKCGCILHFCDHSDYVGPIEPPRPPRFYPVPTQPVLAQGLPPIE
ncbi:MAG: hypothetical protein L0228_16675 [Planctomycetes bacterium]|nr:hypothetical protein [Planctomycetota bacterium]